MRINHSSVLVDDCHRSRLGDHRLDDTCGNLIQIAQETTGS